MLISVENTWSKLAVELLDGKLSIGMTASSCLGVISSLDLTELGLDSIGGCCGGLDDIFVAGTLDGTLIPLSNIRSC